MKRNELRANKKWQSEILPWQWNSPFKVDGAKSMKANYSITRLLFRFFIFLTIKLSILSEGC